MRAAVLFSGGKDSSLAALLLAEFYDVTLVTGTFGIEETAVTAAAREAADALGFPLATASLDRSVAERAVERMVADGYPRNGIQQVHEHALEVVAERHDALLGGDGEPTARDAGRSVVADGTRRDDRAPTVDRSLARSVEDRFDVDYVAPLAGFGRSAVDALVGSELRVETGPSEAIAKADYETELRALLAAEYGEEAVAEVFPEHTQSRVVGRA